MDADDDSGDTSSSEPQTFSLTLVNRKGLHARAAARFVTTVDAFRATVVVTKDGHTVDGRSIMGLLMLGAPCGSTIDVRATGDEAAAVARALTELVGDGFGERD